MPSDPETSSPESLRSAVQLKFRPFELPDRPFILKSWLKSYRKYESGVPDAEYFKGQTALIFSLASRSKLVVACDRENPGYIIGFICGHLCDNLVDTIIHYVYIKDDYRRNGIARDLVTHLGYRQQGSIIATHWTRPVTSICQSYPVIYNPYINVLGA